MTRFFFIASLPILFLPLFSSAHQPATGSWHATLSKPGSLAVSFTFFLAKEKSGKYQMRIVNAADTLLVNDLRFSGDSLFIEMPVFESAFRLRLVNYRQLEGVWLKGGSQQTQVFQFVASRSNQPRITSTTKVFSGNVSGKWQVSFYRPDGTARPAVAQLEQKNDRVTGTILAPSGDYRFLEGAVRGDSLYLTTFDGGHAYALVARVNGDSLRDGLFFSGTVPGERFVAERNALAALPKTDSLIGLRPNAPKLNFAFPSLEGPVVRLSDSRFRQKVVVLQLMGSWCPNCMDETKFLSEVYANKGGKPLEIIALAYELSADSARSRASLRKFQQRFGVQYPILITGARSVDADKAAKTLPQLTDIKYFPTTIMVDKAGKIRYIHNGFYGPGAPVEFALFRQQFFAKLDELMAEPDFVTPAE